MGGQVDPIGPGLTLAEARSALSWWLEAGVDAVVQENPRDWLAPPQAPTRPAPEGESVGNVAPPSHETLAQLQDWLANSAQLPLAASGSKRVMPHGPQDAPVMLLVDAPVLEDAAAGQPIGGEAWLLTQRMLAAIGIEPAQAYSASLTCIHAPGARMSDADRRQCAELAHQQIRLARPQRLILFGDGPCQALLGKRLVEARGHVHKVQGIRTIATFHPRHLIKRPLDKSLAWQDLLLLMEDES